MQIFIQKLAKLCKNLADVSKICNIDVSRYPKIGKILTKFERNGRISGDVWNVSTRPMMFARLQNVENQAVKNDFIIPKMYNKCRPDG